MAGTRKTEDTKEKAKDKRVCTCCGKKTSDKDFYVSKSYLNRHFKRMSICKTCIGNVYEELYKKYNDSKLAIYELCKLLDLPFNLSAYEGAERESLNTKTQTYQVYITKINSLGDTNNYGNCFSEGQKLEEFSKAKVQENHSINIDDFEVTSDLIHKWGNLNKEDIAYLENEYFEWCSRYDVSTKSMELLVQEICYQQLTIKRKREQREPVSKELKDLQDLMNSSALRPIQESAVMGADINTLGTWIKKFENERPIPDPDKEFLDVDGIKKYIRIWFLGHFSRMLGVNNDYSKEYEDEINKYKVSIDEVKASTEEGADNGMDE